MGLACTCDGAGRTGASLPAWGSVNLQEHGQPPQPHQQQRPRSQRLPNMQPRSRAWGSEVRILKAATTWSSLALPPTSRKLAGEPPRSCGVAGGGAGGRGLGSRSITALKPPTSMAARPAPCLAISPPSPALLRQITLPDRHKRQHRPSSALTNAPPTHPHLDDVHSGHGQPRAVDHAPNGAVQANVVQVVLGRRHLAANTVNIGVWIGVCV